MAAERFINLAPRAIRVARGVRLEPGQVMCVNKRTGRLMAAKRGRHKIRRLVDVQADLHNRSHTYPDKHAAIILEGMGESVTKNPRSKLKRVIDALVEKEPGPAVNPLTGDPLPHQPDVVEEVEQNAKEPVELDLDERRQLVAKMAEDGHTHQEIADKVGVSASTVSNDLKAMAKDDDE